MIDVIFKVQEKQKTEIADTVGRLDAYQDIFGKIRNEFRETSIQVQSIFEKQINATLDTYKKDIGKGISEIIKELEEHQVAFERNDVRFNTLIARFDDM